MQVLISQMFRFGLVGLFNAGVDAAVFFAALATLTSSLIAANILAWLVAVTSSYALNARYTFIATWEGLRFANYLTFALTQVGGFIAHTVVLVAAAPHVPLVLAKVLGIGVGFLLNFSLARAIVFRAR